MKHNYNMKKQLISLSLLCLSAVAMAQNIGDADIVEHTISKTIVDFGDTYIETTKSDVFYIKAPETNTANISVKVVFDEDRNNNCYNPNDVYATEFTKGIFEVFVDGVELVSTEMTYTSFFSENDMGNTTIELAPGDSSRVEVKATPANHYGPQYLVEDGNWEHCYMGKEPIYSLEYQSDMISIQNITNSEISTVGIGFNGTNDPTDVAPCIVNIPDANFKAYLVGNTAINTNGDSEIQCSEATAFNGQINCSSLSISDLTGIEEFTALTYLNCYKNQLTSLDVSNNKDLYYLSCSINQLTSLDVSKNTVLEELGCGSNQLTSLDVSNNLNLTSLHFYQNNIVNMDLSNLDGLVKLNCLDNSLTNLNVANGNNTNFTTFNTTKNPNLTCIQVDDATYSTTNWTDVDTTASFSENCSSCIVNIPDANFKAYLVGNTAINTNEDTEIQCSEATAFNGSISCHSRSISNLTGIEAFSGITELWCHNNSLINIDVSNNINLTALSCGVNSLSSLDISNNLNLTQLYCATNSLTNLSLLTNTNLTNVNCSNNFITSLDVSNNINLTSLECNDNSINNIDVSNHPNIIRVACTNNALDNLNVANGNNTNVIGFFATGNPSLTCIQVDDATYSSTNWVNGIDSTASFNTNCGALGITDFNNESLSIYPNPATSIINTDIGQLEIIDTLGNKVLSTESTGKVDVSSLEAGIYIVVQNNKRGTLIIE